MKTFKVKFLLNRVSFDVNNIVWDVIEYNEKHGVKLIIDIEHIDVHGYQSVYTQVRPNWSQYILAGSQNCVPVNDADITVFSPDTDEWKTTPGSLYPLKPETPSGSCFLFNNKPFINIPLWSRDEITGINANTFCHELMHAYCYIANVKGLPVQDVMDTYFHNEDRNFPTGNFAQQWGLLAPLLADAAHPVLRIGSKGEAVKELQNDLNTLTYSVGLVDGEFGPKTAAGVESFQRAHSLVPDKIVGKNTWKIIDDLLVKKKL